MIKLGEKVRDKVSGWTGTTVSKVEWLNGCIQFGVQGKLTKGIKEITTYNIDEVQLVSLSKPKTVKKFKKGPGGPTTRVY